MSGQPLVLLCTAYSATSPLGLQGAHHEGKNMGSSIPEDFGQGTVPSCSPAGLTIFWISAAERTVGNGMRLI